MILCILHNPASFIENWPEKNQLPGLLSVLVTEVLVQLQDCINFEATTEVLLTHGFKAAVMDRLRKETDKVALDMLDKGLP